MVERTTPVGEWRDQARRLLAIVLRPPVRLGAGLLLLVTGLEVYHVVGEPDALLGPRRLEAVGQPALAGRAHSAPPPGLTGTGTSPAWSDNDDVIVRGLRAWRDGAEMVAEIGVEMKLLGDQEERRRNVYFILAPDGTMNLIFADGTAQAVPILRAQGASLVQDVFRPRNKGDDQHAVWPATWPPGTHLSPAGVNVVTLWGAVPAKLQAMPLARIQVNVRALTRGAVRAFEARGGARMPMVELLRGALPFVVEPRLDLPVSAEDRATETGATTEPVAEPAGGRHPRLRPTRQ
jgi:hypothetical protein